MGAYVRQLHGDGAPRDCVSVVSGSRDHSGGFGAAARPTVSPTMPAKAGTVSAQTASRPRPTGSEKVGQIEL